MWSSASRSSACTTSWGTTLPPKTRAKASPTIPWRRRSNLSTRPNRPSSVRIGVLLAMPIVSVLARAVELPVGQVDRWGGQPCFPALCYLRFRQGEWRNGRRARFRSVCPKGREGSTPSSPTLPPPPIATIIGVRCTAGRSGWSASTRRSASAALFVAHVGGHASTARSSGRVRVERGRAHPEVHRRTRRAGPGPAAARRAAPAPRRRGARCSRRGRRGRCGCSTAAAAPGPTRPGRPGRAPRGAAPASSSQPCSSASGSVRPCSRRTEAGRRKSAASTTTVARPRRAQRRRDLGGQLARAGRAPGRRGPGAPGPAGRRRARRSPRRAPRGWWG